jgi:hypothetical protein
MLILNTTGELQRGPYKKIKIENNPTHLQEEPLNSR